MPVSARRSGMKSSLPLRPVFSFTLFVHSDQVFVVHGAGGSERRLEFRAPGHDAPARLRASQRRRNQRETSDADVDHVERYRAFEDWFKFTLSAPQDVVITIDPTGGNYTAGFQSADCDGTLQAINAENAGDLNVSLFLSDGSTLQQAVVNAGGVGVTFGTGADNQTYITTDGGQFKNAVAKYFGAPVRL